MADKEREREKRMSLGGRDAAAAAVAHAAAANELLTPHRFSTVMGVAVGVKWSEGEPTGEPAILALVSQKLAKDALPPGELVPSAFDGIKTDVLSVGVPLAGRDEPQNAGIQTLTRRARPARGGSSIGHHLITAGTLGTCVYDLLPGASVSPPRHGTGMPSRYYVLSNNHVLANSNNASLGDPILQPGPFDGGVNPVDRIASLSRFIPIGFGATDNNLVDAAIAEGQFHDLDREVVWNGPVRGWLPKGKVTVGLAVKKTGRTTSFTVGRVTAVNATIQVNYGSGRVARFVDQIVTTPMSAGGDSGSLIMTLDNLAVGLLFAGSPLSTIANQIEHVRSLLRVEVADQVF
jgi:hypothetical protein